MNDENPKNGPSDDPRESRDPEFHDAHMRIDSALATVRDQAHEMLEESKDPTPGGPRSSLSAGLDAIRDASAALHEGHARDLDEALKLLASIAIIALADRRAPNANQLLDAEIGGLPDPELDKVEARLGQHWKPVEPGAVADLLGAIAQRRDKDGRSGTIDFSN